jgi:hypothetical protein
MNHTFWGLLPLKAYRVNYMLILYSNGPVPYPQPAKLK